MDFLFLRLTYLVCYTHVFHVPVNPPLDPGSTSTGDDIDMAALSPLFSPSELESSRKEPFFPVAPLFLHVSCSVQECGEEKGEGEIVPSLPPTIPVCLSE